jgi:hypothetical protein
MRSLDSLCWSIAPDIKSEFGSFTEDSRASRNEVFVLYRESRSRLAVDIALTISSLVLSLEQYCPSRYILHR